MPDVVLVAEGDQVAGAGAGGLLEVLGDAQRRRCGSTRKPIARPGRSRRQASSAARASSTQPSVEASSDSTISEGGRVWRQMLRTCSADEAGAVVGAEGDGDGEGHGDWQARLADRIGLRDMEMPSWVPVAPGRSASHAGRDYLRKSGH